MFKLVKKINTQTAIILLFVVFILISNSLTAQQFKDFSDEKLVSFNLTKKRVEEQLQKIRIEAEQNNDSLLLNRVLLSQSRLCRRKNQYSQAMDLASNTLLLAQERNDARLQANAHEEIGAIFFLFKQDIRAEGHFDQAEKLYKTIGKEYEQKDYDLFRSYYNKILICQRTFDGVTLQQNLDQCKSFIKQGKVDPIYLAYLHEKKACLLLWKNNFDNALTELQKAEKLLENTSNNYSKASDHKTFLMIVYSVIGNIYETKGDRTKAIYYFQKSVDCKDTSGENIFYLSYAHQKHSILLHRNGEIDKAYIELQKAKKTNDVYLNPRNENTHDILQIKSRYEDELAIKESEIRNQSIALAQKNQTILRIQIVLITLFLSLLIVGIIYRTRKDRSKLKKAVEEEQKTTQLKQNQLDSKNRELTANMLHLIEKEEIIDKLKSQLLYIDKSGDSKRLIKSVESDSTNLWDTFNAQFIELNNDFYERLNKKAPNLTGAEMKICALIKLNMTGHQMAHLLGISLGSVHVARHRLRKKLDLNRDDNLTKFIHNV